MRPGANPRVVEAATVGESRLIRIRSLGPVLVLSLSAVSCGGGAGTPSSPGVTPPPPPPLPPEIGTPCPGTVVRGHPPTRGELAGVGLVIDWEQRSGGGFDWAGPYYDDEDDPEDRRRYPLLEVNVAAWRVDAVDGVTRHTLQIEWPPFLPAELLFRSDAGRCLTPRLTCSASACELGP
ncbi:MAG: hypothetical protein OYK82_05885 [Gammaproteobacteria bacterium]|nr:hypothetical protein [Gammaproteobacteria bacterium]MDE2880488.1 hypothetical protein [Acidobacteriota bacterium]